MASPGVSATVVDTDLYRYEGQVRAGTMTPHGRCVATWPGKGTYSSNDGGNQYEGGWQDGTKSGQERAGSVQCSPYVVARGTTRPLRTREICGQRAHTTTTSHAHAADATRAHASTAARADSATTPLSPRALRMHSNGPTCFPLYSPREA
jgi:hypothetical protein